MSGRGVHSTLVGVLAGSTLVFAWLAVGVAAGGPIVSLDNAIAAWLHAHATGSTTDLLGSVTQLGGATVLLAITVVAAFGLLLLGRVAHAALMAAALAGGEGLNVALKAAFERPRPGFSDPLATAAGFSFPSGHAMVSLTVYGALAFILAARVGSRRARVAIVVSAVALVVAIGVSRAYLGVHYVSDVVAGYCAGLAWLGVCALGLLGPAWRRERSPLGRPRHVAGEIPTA